MKYDSMTNLRLPPRYRVRCHAQRAAAAPWPMPRRHAGHAGQRGRHCSLPPCSIAAPAPFPPSARCCGLQHQQRAACPCAPALHPHPICTLPRTISRRFQHGALAPLSRGCNTNAAPPPASPLPSAAHEALRRATTPRGWPRRRWIYFRKQTKCKKKARAAARRYSTGLRGA